jgi:hypothetical protein
VGCSADVVVASGMRVQRSAIQHINELAHRADKRSFLDGASS